MTPAARIGAACRASGFEQTMRPHPSGPFVKRCRRLAADPPIAQADQTVGKTCSTPLVPERCNARGCWYRARSSAPRAPRDGEIHLLKRDGFGGRRHHAFQTRHGRGGRHQLHPAVVTEKKVHPVAGVQMQALPQWFGEGDLAFAAQGGFQGLPRVGFLTMAPWIIRLRRGLRVSPRTPGSKSVATPRAFMSAVLVTFRGRSAIDQGTRSRR